MEGFSWTISGATIVVAIGWCVTVVAFIWRRSSKEATDDAAFLHLRNAHDALAKAGERDRERAEEERSQSRKERDMFQTAMNAGLTEAGGKLQEFKEHAAKTYATKAELVSLEERTGKGMDRIADRLEGISGRLETIGDSIMKALIDRPHH